MKNRIFRFLMILAGTAFAAVSCERAELEEKPEYVTSIEVSIEQPDFSEFETGTKASYSLDANNRPVASWSEDDIIGIYPVGGDQVAFNLSGNITDGKAVFDGGSWSLKTEYQYAAYCPFNEDYYHRKESSLPVSYNGQKQTGDNSVDHLGAFAYMASAASSPNERGEVSIALKSIGCIVQLKVKLPEGMPVAKLTLTDKTEDLVVGGKMDLTQTDVTALKSPVYSQSISIDCDNLTAGTDPVKVWIMLPPQDLRGHELELTASTPGGGTVSATMASCAKNLTANGAYVLDFADASTDYTPDYLYFTAEAEGSTIYLANPNYSGTWKMPELEYSTDGKAWQPFIIGRDGVDGTVITLQKLGDKVYFRGDNATFNQYTEFVKFVMSGKIAASGNIMTLLDPEGRRDSVPEFAFASLFSSCRSLVAAPELPATALDFDCYYSMFGGCTNLTTAPELPATTLAHFCYENMFDGCTNLTTAPELPATTLAMSCYMNMFDGCTNLTTAPELPATTLASSCYFKMFKGCSGLTSAPVLPATKLVSSCYLGMFQDCSSLEKAPVLPATTLAYQCYYKMFENCSELNRIEAYFTDWNETNQSTENWVDGVASTGTFVCTPDLLIENGESRIPEGWTVVQEGGDSEDEETPDYFYISAELPNTVVKMHVTGTGWELPELEYSTDRRNWRRFIPGETNVHLPHPFDKVWFRGDNSYISKDMNNGIFFEVGSSWGNEFSAGGNIMSLLDRTCQSKTISSPYAFLCLFQECKGLTSAPELPATTLSEGCYWGLFSNCSKLKEAPNLPATRLADYCYAYLFQGCSSLTQAPELPVTTLAKGCYEAMFMNCKGLTEAPYLPATRLVDYCYETMFEGCSNLNSVNVEFTDWTGPEYPTYDWLKGVAETGDFICPVGLADEGGASRIPENWTLVTIGGAPEGTPDYFYLSAEMPNTTVSMAVTGSGWNLPVLEYSKDRINWKKFTPGETTVTLTHIPGKVWFRGDNRYFSNSDSEYITIETNSGGRISAGGNIMSLLDKTCQSKTITDSYTFRLLFNRCEGLVSVSDLQLPATTLSDYCYAGMFNGCSNLPAAPKLPATSLTEGCYSAMFRECSSLTKAPELPATTLAAICYNNMFCDCTGLTEAPYLPATQLADYCYQRMFYGCSSLKAVNVEFTDWTGHQYPTYDWLSGVAERGDFNCPAALTDNRGTDYIPTKWNKVAPDDKYLTFIPETNETHQVSFVIEGNPSIGLEYKTDDMASWQSYTNGTTISFDYPNHLHFRGDNASFSTNSTNYGHFIVDGEMEVCGNIMTLLDKSGKSTTIPTQYCFYRLFEENEDLIDAGRLELPASILKQWCYAFMFSNCQYMESGPVIPDATAAAHSYDSIFSECQSLVSNGQGTDGVTINLTGTLPEGCLDNAFYDCYYLTKITVKFNSCGYPVTTDWLSGTGEYADEEGETLEFWCNQTFYDNLQRLGAERDRSDNVPNIWDVKRL